MTKIPVASIIIPNWNGLSLLKKNLPLVLKTTTNKSNRIYEVIVVDDGSTDGSVEYLSKLHNKGIKLVKHTKNRGFAAAVNTGVRSSKSKFVVLLNTDVVPSNNFLKNVYKLFEDKKIFAVSFHEDGWGYSVGDMEDGFSVHKPGREVEETHESLWASGGSAIFRRSVWIKLKGFDEELFGPFYWEDVDLSYRAQKRGYKILWEPTAKVEHKHESTINTSSFRKRYLNSVKERNQLFFIWKNITSKNLFRKHRRALFKRVVRHPGYVMVLLRTIPKIQLCIRRRRVEKKEGKISDESILSIK